MIPGIVEDYSHSDVIFPDIIPFVGIGGMNSYRLQPFCDTVHQMFILCPSAQLFFDVS